MKTAAQRRQEGIAKAHAQIAAQNAEELAAAKLENGTWTFSLHGQANAWNKTAHGMISDLAEREGVTAESLDVCVMLPERGRTFTKTAGSGSIIAHG